MNLAFIVFFLLALHWNSMNQLIYNRCTCKAIIKTAAAYVYANEQLHLCHLCVYFLVRYFVA